MRTPLNMRIIQVKVKPGARRSLLSVSPDGLYVAEVKAQPVDGKANAELLALVAAHFGCPRAAVRIKSGGSARTKRIQISDARA